MAINVLDWVWNNSKARPIPRFVLLAIADNASSDGDNAWPSNAELVRKTGLSPRGVQVAIGELIALGELEVAYNQGRRGCNRYRVIMPDGPPPRITDSDGGPGPTPAGDAPPQEMHPAGAAPPQDVRGSEFSQATGTNPAPDPAGDAPPQEMQGAADAPGTVLKPLVKSSTKTSRSKRDLNAGREDARRLCEHLAERIEGNGSLRPKVTKDWLDAARLMLDTDGRTEDHAHVAIDWCQANEFWRRNILSMPKLREQYDRLRMQAADERKRNANGRASAAPGPDRARGWMEAARVHNEAARQAGRELPHG